MLSIQPIIILSSQFLLFLIQEAEELPSLPQGSLDEEERAFHYAESISVDILPESPPSNGMESGKRGQPLSEREQQEDKGGEKSNLEKQELTASCESWDEASTRDLAKCVICRFVH